MELFIFAIAVLPAVFAVPGSPDEYFDILASGQKEWRLAFRGTANIKQSVYEAYTEGYTQDVDADCKTADFSRTCTTHYRNDDALDNSWMVDEVLFGVVKDGVMVKTVRFNGTGSDYLSWFSQENYDGDSCYANMDNTPKNYFSIEGHNNRRFFINSEYNKCENNEGWFVAVDSNDFDCNWERNQGDFPILKFAAGPRVINWNDPGANLADAFVVFIKYYPYPGQPTEYFDVLEQGNNEWRLAFRASSNVGVPVYQAYIKGTGIPADVDEGCMSNDFNAECKSHYRNNDALNNYKWQEIDQVLFGIVDNNAIVKTITFDAKGTNYINWYQNAKVVETCWVDFEKSPKNFFSIAGDNAPPRVQRMFFISNKYGGCPSDIGWVVAIDNAPKPPCPWEQGTAVPSLKYAAGLTKTNFNDKTTTKDAQAFVIYFRYKVFAEV